MSFGQDQPNRCVGTFPRRAFLRTGLIGWGSLSLAELLRCESRASAAGIAPVRKKSMIVLWLWGGPSHMETFDLKPDAPLEFRGEFRPVRTRVPGIEMSIFLAGGGMPMGQVIGSTTAKGEEPAERPLSPNDVLATWYEFLGIPCDTQFHDHFGRPIPILPHGTPIHELI